MRDFKGNSLQARRENAEKAKQALRQLAQSMPGPNDPAFVARQAELKAIAEAREARAAARAEAKAQAERERLEREAAEKAALEAKQKAERDARYAARKKRKKKKK
jgi:hypothetical protein